MATTYQPGARFIQKTVSDPLLLNTFWRFRRILELNNKALEKINWMEETLGGGYIFDQAFLWASVSELGEIIREVIHSLNSLSGNAYIGLYDRFESIRNNLEDITSGGPGPYRDQIVISYAHLTRDLDQIAGAKNANLGEIRNRLRLKTPEGFALTVAAYRLFMDENDLFRQVRCLLEDEKQPEKAWAHILRLFKKAEMPGVIKSSVRDGLERLYAGLGNKPLLAVRSSAVGEDRERSFAGQFHTILNVHPDNVFDACKEVMAARFSPQVLAYMGSEALDDEKTPVAVGIQAMIPARVSGVVYTRDPAEASMETMAVSAVQGLGEELVGGAVDSDWYRILRLHPFPPVESRIRGGQVLDTQPDGYGPLAVMPSGLRRGSFMVSRGFFKTIAEAAITLEKAFGTPQDVEWAIDDMDALVILQSRPLHIKAAPSMQPVDAMARLKTLPVIMDGKGQVAQIGIASGRVAHVSPDDDPADFPAGAIAVCKNASPRLSLIIQKAAAIVTDVGGPTGHLATIAREYRTPALLGTGNATATLKDGMEVTLDAEDRRVYAGMSPGLVDMRAAAEEVFLESREARILRRLLRWIAPLNLVDPSSPGFMPENCETYHDILRFAHEKAIDILIHIQSSPSSHEKAPNFHLIVPIPIGISVIDLGGGVGPQTDGEGIEVSMILSRPFKAILDGLLAEGAWDTEPAAFGIKDILSSISRPVSALSSMPEYSGRNLAVIADGYCNLSLRLGYHFNVIDAYLSSNPDDNYIYFRFAGGFAEEEKRMRRAIFIESVLQALFFRVERHGDLVVGKAKVLEADQMEYILTRLGELIAFTRQLDVRMVADESVDHFFARFLEQTKRRMA
jgi:pyruvate,water dikinase